MSKIVHTGFGTALLALIAVASPAQNPAPSTGAQRPKPVPQPAQPTQSAKATPKTTGTTPPKSVSAPTPAPTSATGAKAAPALTDEQRETMKKAAHFEQVHRFRTARINRLIRIYTAKGEDAKVKKLEEMKTKEAKRTENAMAGYRKSLGEENWARMNAEWKHSNGRAEKAATKK